MSISPEEKETSQQDTLVGRRLRNGEYVVQEKLTSEQLGQTYRALHTALNLPLTLTQIAIDQPLPASVSAELDEYLRPDETLVQQKRNNNADSGKADLFPTSGGESTDYFIHAALRLARLQYPTIPALYDYFRADGYWYLVTTFVPGVAFDQFLQQRGPLPTLEALSYAMQICSFLDYLHHQQPPIILYDLRPADLLTTTDGMLFLTNIECLDERMQRVVSGYMAPEQRKNRSADPRSDLYTLGVILYEMLSGRAATIAGVELAEGVHGYQREQSISVALASLIKLATRTDPVYRFQNAQTCLLSLERTYRIEERRSKEQQFLMQQHPYSRSADENSARDDDLPAAHTEVEQTFVADTFSLFDPEQRQRTRDAMQQMRMQRIEIEQMEQHFVSVDENLTRRSNISLSHISSPAAVAAVNVPKNVQQSPKYPDRLYVAREQRNGHRFARFGLMLALICFLIMALLLFYNHFTQPQDQVVTQPTATTAPTQQSAPTPTVAKTATPTAPPQAQWQVLPSLPGVEADNAAAYVQLQGREYIYVNGGYRGTPQYISSANPHDFYDHNLYRYDIAAQKWQTVPSQLPGMVNNAVAVDENGTLFFSNGYSSDSYQVVSQLYQYQPANGNVRTITPPATMPLGFANSMLADQHGHLYITQGFMTPGKPQETAGTGWYRYDIETGQWHQLAPLPAALGYVTLSSDNNGTILLIGGASDAGQHDQQKSIFRYTVSNDSWSQLAVSTPKPMSGSASCTIWPDQLMIVGGYDNARGTGSRMAWLFDTQTLHWKQLPALLAGSVLGTATCDGNGHAFIARGVDQPTTPTHDFWEGILASNLVG